MQTSLVFSREKTLACRYVETSDLLGNDWAYQVAALPADSELCHTMYYLIKWTGKTEEMSEVHLT